MPIAPVIELIRAVCAFKFFTLNVSRPTVHSQDRQIGLAERSHDQLLILSGILKTGKCAEGSEYRWWSPQDDRKWLKLCQFIVI